MSSALLYQLLAGAVLILHFSVIVFVVGGLVAVVVGNLRKWAWVNRLWFRAAHVGAIGFVVAESWLDIPCPLTTLEAWLRARAGAATYSQGGFIEYWLQRALSYEVPPWVFAFADSAFGLLVIAAWWYFPPRRTKARREGGA